MIFPVIHRAFGFLTPILLLIALAMGDKDLDDVNPVVVAEVVGGLRRIGLGAAARKLAMEAAINAGL